MPTITTYRKICNVSQPATPAAAAAACALPEGSAQLYMGVPMRELADQIAAGSGVPFLLQHFSPKQFSEEQLFAAADGLYEKVQQLEQERAELDMYKHIHNLKSLAMDPMFSSFKQHLAAALSKPRMQLVESCTDFKSFSKVMLDINDNQVLVAEVRGAARGFIKEFSAVDMFWAQASAVYKVNTQRNQEQEVDVGDSATFIISELKEHPQRWMSSGAMLQSLANFALKNAASLREMAKRRQEAATAATEAFKRLHM